MLSFGWLHISDLHQGLDGHDWLWPNVREVLLADLEKLHARCGPWDLVLFSGDLTQRGSTAEFERVNQTLQQLWDHLGSLGSSPALLSVPGNHDLIRPDPRRPESLVLGSWDTSPDVQVEFWRDASSPYRTLVDQAFAPFSNWLKSHPFTGLELQHGMLPGDCSAVLTKDGLKLGVVGLNSAFLQIGDGDYTGKLALDVRQFHAACGGDGPAWVKDCDFALLMTHHPPSWLGSKARAELASEIAPPGRFVAHLFGHMHEHSSTVLAIGGALPRRELQASSIFGLEMYDGKVQRRHGYTAARITVDDTNNATLRLWPRVARKHAAGHWHLVPDFDAFELEDDQGTRAEPLPPTRNRLARSPVPQSASSAELRRCQSQAREEYLRNLIAVVRERQTIGGLANFAVELAGLFIEREFTFIDEPAYARTSLLSWIRAQADGEALLLLGDPGSGKSELLFHTAARLAELALEEPAAPLPIIITAAQLVGGKNLENALRTQGYATEVFLAEFGATRCILLLDGLDEAPTRPLLELLTLERNRLGPKLVALVTTSRPAFVPPLRRCRQATLCPWSLEDSREFLFRWAHHDAISAEQIQSRLVEPGIAEMFTNPLTATLSVFTVRQSPDALRSRARLYSRVYGRVLQQWPGQRSSDSATNSAAWSSVSDILREIATDCLRAQRTSIERSELEARLQAHAPDEWSRILDQIQLRFGILAPYSNQDFQFHDRRLMEFLAAEWLLRTPGELLVCVLQPWAHEPVRLAFGLLAAQQPEYSRALFSALVIAETKDIPGIQDQFLRAVLVAIDVAGDEQALDAAVAPNLAEAVFRRVTEEFSNWVGDTVTRHARHLARRGGSTFALLAPRLLEVLTHESLRRPFVSSEICKLITSREQAVMALLHRDAQVRGAACQYLEHDVDDPDIQNRLTYMMLDQGSTWDMKIPLVAGAVLRRATRCESFATTLQVLRQFLSFQAQTPSCGAAIALHPGEAPAKELVAALGHGLEGTGAIPSEVFEALEADPEGGEALRTILPDWRDRLEKHAFPSAASTSDLPKSGLPHMPYSAHCRGRAFELLAASPSTSVDFMEVALSIPDNLHAYTESLDILSENDLYRLLDRVREEQYTLCSVAEEKLGQRATREPRLSVYVLEWWRTLLSAPAHVRLHRFPGRALEPLLLLGDRAAIDAYVEWLPHGRLHFGTSYIDSAFTHVETSIPREVFAIPEIRNVAYLTLNSEQQPIRLLHLQRLARAWEHDTAKWQQIDGLLAKEHNAWLDATADNERLKHWSVRNHFVNLRAVEFPAFIRGRFAEIFDTVVRSPRHREPGKDSIEWHGFVARALAFIADNGLAPDVEPALRFLAGDGALPPCKRVWLPAACCLADRLSPPQVRQLSQRLAQEFPNTYEFNLVDKQLLAALISHAPESWSPALEQRLEQHRTTFSVPEDILGIFAALPPPQQQRASDALVNLAQIAPIPWVKPDWRSRQLVRLADEILRVAFMTRVR